MTLTNSLDTWLEFVSFSSRFLFRLLLIQSGIGSHGLLQHQVGSSDTRLVAMGGKEKAAAGPQRSKPRKVYLPDIGRQCALRAGV